jgi:curved DNA-binding protein CbpA
VVRPPWWELDGHDAYELLGVAEDATLREIVAAHRRQMKVWHTDTSKFATAEERSRYLNTARDVLERHRAAYDEFRRRSVEPESAPPDPWDEIPEDPWEEVPDDPWQRAETGPPPPSSPWPPEPEPYDTAYPPPAEPVYERPFHGRPSSFDRGVKVAGWLVLCVITPPVGFLVAVIAVARSYRESSRGSGFQPDTGLSRLWRWGRTPMHERSPAVRVLTVAVLVFFTLVAPPLGLVLSAITVFRMYRQGARGWDFQWAVAVLVGAIPWWIVYAALG